MPGNPWKYLKPEKRIDRLCAGNQEACAIILPVAFGVIDSYQLLRLEAPIPNGTYWNRVKPKVQLSRKNNVVTEFC